jgi:serine/threonine-protein kinase
VEGNLIGQSISHYKVLEKLGEGGMGKVYLAEDTSLKRKVALKFLPASLADDPIAHKRFLREAESAAGLDHPFICHINEVSSTEDGQNFISMEFVLGQSLKDRLAKGLLPIQDALQLGIELAEALEVAHQAGVVHRDLKPANIMLTVQGHAKVMDFGLAKKLEPEEGDEHDITAGLTLEGTTLGTLPYMSPEQARGEQADHRSDIFAFGIVLYEVITGVHPFRKRTRVETLSSILTEDPDPISQYVEAVPQLLDDLITRALAKSPSDRPRDMSELRNCLANLAIANLTLDGETPSPSIVAAAGSVGTIRLLPASACVATIILGLAYLLWASELSLIHRVGLTRSPELLAEDARQIIQAFGYDEPFADWVYDFSRNRDFLDHVEKADNSPRRWDRLDRPRPAGITFWYRESPVPMASTTGPLVSYTDPPPLVAGMKSLRLGPDGLLIEFQAVPVGEDKDFPAVTTDWELVFEKAGLELERFEIIQSNWLPPVYADSTRSWEGTYPQEPEVRIRVEGGQCRGRLVYFRIFEPWTTERRFMTSDHTTAQTVAGVIAAVLVLTLVVGSLILARRNVRRGRGDPQGAFRLSSFLFVASMISWLFRADHVADLGGEAVLLFHAASSALFFSAIVWLLYVVLEPYLRRRWPEGCISWNRLLSGRIGDPLIARDLLIGATAGVLTAAFSYLRLVLPNLMGTLPPGPFWIDDRLLLGLRYLSADLVDGLSIAILNGLGFFFLLFLIRLVFRRDWIAPVLVFLLICLVQVLVPHHPDGPLVWEILILALIWPLIVYVMLRFGLLAGIASMFVSNVLLSNPLSADLSVFFVEAAVFPLVVVAAIAGYGFWISADRSSFLRRRLEEFG